MSSRGGNGGGGVQSIPAALRKMVQSLKEIVDFPESEIYAMLKECNMDPNETVNRLISQDPFHEVKSKREKKKENKDPIESRSRGISSTSNRVGRGSSSDLHTGRGGSTQFSSSESGALHGKPANKKENGTHNYSSPLSVSFGMTRHNLNQQSPAQSGSAASENKVTTVGTVNGTLSSSQPPGYHAAWSGVPGQVSMADIVKMGRSHSKASSEANPSQYGVNQNHIQTSRSFEGNVSDVLELNHELVVGTGYHISSNDDWPLMEQLPAVCVPPVLEQPVDSYLHVGASNVSTDVIRQHPQPPNDEFQNPEDEATKNINTYFAGSGSTSATTCKMPEDNPSSDFLFSDGMYENMAFYQTQKSGFEHQEAEDGGASVSAVISNLHQLSVHEDRSVPPEEDNPPPPVMIPIHLQVQTADCSHLSFGSFGSGIGGSAFSRPLSSRPMQNNAEESSADADASPIEHPVTRNPEYYIDESLRAASDRILVHRTGTTTGRSDSPSSSQPEVLNKDTEAPHENQYSFQSSTSSYNFVNGQQLSSQMQNLAPFSSVMQAYTNTLPSSLLAASVHPARESALPYLPFSMTHTVPTKNGNAVSSISSSTISLPEALKTSGFSSTQPTAQTLTRSNIGTGPALPHHLAMHPYSQPTVPSGPFANMIGYPFLPQSYTYMPSPFQQPFAGNSAYHQSLAAVLPQYKNVSVSNLPRSAALASGYGGFGSSTSIPGNISMSPSSSSGPTTISYDDLMSSQYKDSNYLISAPQNENSPLWDNGAGSRTLPPVPSSTYYSYNGQSQQRPSSGYHQTRQPSQNYAGLEYPNFYHSQSGMLLEHQQQQNPRDVHLVSSQAQASKQSQRLWQNSY